MPDVPVVDEPEDDQVIEPLVLPVVEPEFQETDPSVPATPARPPTPITPEVKPVEPIVVEEVVDDDPETTTFNDTVLYTVAPKESVAVILNW